jgi:hypothetical protein
MFQRMQETEMIAHEKRIGSPSFSSPKPRTFPNRISESVISGHRNYAGFSPGTLKNEHQSLETRDI